LVPRLLDEGFEVTATDRDLDVSDRAAVEARLKQALPKAIVHLAAQSSVAASAADPEQTHRINYGGALSVLEGALRCGSRPRVLLIGSADQYGRAVPGSPPFTEDSPLAPTSAYARSKTEAERLGTSFLDAGLEVVRIRAFSHSGPGQSDAFALSSFARQIAEIEAGRRKPVLRVGNLDSVRDYLDVDDVVEAYLRLLDPTVGADIYNVASGVGTRLGDLLDALLYNTQALVYLQHPYQETVIAIAVGSHRDIEVHPGIHVVGVCLAQVPGHAGALGFFTQRGEVAQFLGQLVDAEHRFQRTAGVFLETLALGLGGARIGVAGMASVRRTEGVIPHETWSRITKALPKASFASAEEVLDRARVVKGPEEVALVEAITTANEDAIAKMMETARPGVEEGAVWVEMNDVLIRHTAEYPSRLSLGSNNRRGLED
ncbi:MAG: GDP-mannose 4,6-dehydratase, partial [Bacteroidetes bacterium]|nr:GDP-mannose 4,6-dehydratase [Bacteroidota bacterium]